MYCLRQIHTSNKQSRVEVRHVPNQLEVVSLTASRKHLYLDLRPYTCLFQDCTFSQEPFVTRQLWSDHLELGHDLGPGWEAVHCPLCLDIIECGKSVVLSHFARHMEDIALASLPRDVESEVESGSEDGSESKNKFAVAEPERLSLRAGDDDTRSSTGLAIEERSGVTYTASEEMFVNTFDKQVPSAVFTNLTSPDVDASPSIKDTFETSSMLPGEPLLNDTDDWADSFVEEKSPTTRVR